MLNLEAESSFDIGIVFPGLHFCSKILLLSRLRYLIKRGNNRQRQRNKNPEDLFISDDITWHHLEKIEHILDDHYLFLAVNHSLFVTNSTPIDEGSHNICYVLKVLQSYVLLNSIFIEKLIEIVLQLCQYHRRGCMNLQQLQIDLFLKLKLTKLATSKVENRMTSEFLIECLFCFPQNFVDVSLLSPNIISQHSRHTLLSNIC